MSKDEQYTERDAHCIFAIQYHGQTWDLLDQAERSKEQDALMIHSAHASCRHWQEVGTGLHHQRGEWLISRIYAVLAQAGPALYHADRCLALAQSHADLMADFDRAFAYEAVARANAIAGNRDRAIEYVGLAEKAGQAIASEDERTYFMDDLEGGNWGGLR